MPSAIIIFICTFDPFDMNLSKYTFKNMCTENPDLYLEDDAYKIFINTHGDRHRISKALANLMDYINGQEPSDDFTRQLDAEVELQKNDDGRRALYMVYSQTLMEREYKGFQRGMEQGIEQGMERGTLKTLYNLVKDGLITNVEAAKRAGMSLEEFTKAVAML